MKGTFVRAQWGVLVLTGTLLLVSGGWQPRSGTAADGNVYQQARLFERVLTTINHQYIDSLGQGALYRAAATTLVASLGDPYAELLTGESYRQHQLQMAGDEVGELAPPGERTMTRRVSPTLVHVSAVSPGVLLGNGIGYIALHRMSEGASDELRTEIDLLQSQGMTRLVLDLRLNPGGLINQGVKIAGLFLTPGDTVATSVGRTVQRSRVYLAAHPGSWGELPLALLVNRGTASSAELIAAALQDRDRAVIVGTPTYGKGVLQTTYPLGKDAALKLTTARWYAPSGRSVQRPRPDSSGTEARQATPDSNRVFKTRLGRPVKEGSGVVPDLLVHSAGRSDRERAFLATLGSGLAVFHSDLTALAQALAAQVKEQVETFEVTQQMRDQLFDSLVAHGVDVPREIYVAAAEYVDDQLDYEVAGFALGPMAEARQRIRRDRQLQAALTVLRRAETREQALAITALTRRAAR